MGVGNQRGLGRVSGSGVWGACGGTGGATKETSTLHVLFSSFYLKENRFKASMTKCEQLSALDSGHRGVYHRRLCTFSVFQKFILKIQIWRWAGQL